MRIIDFFDQGVAYYPQNTAFVEVETGAKLTYAEADARAHHVAASIRGHGYAKGTHAGILAPNSNIAFVVLVGLFRAECVWLPVNPRNSLDVNVEMLDQFKCELLFYHSIHEAEALKIRQAVPAIHDLICLDREGPDVSSLDYWTANYRRRHEVGAELPNDLLGIFPTGGTTGRSKGVLMSHQAVEAMFANSYAHFKHYDGSVHLVVAPMTHAAGMLACTHFARGGANVMMTKADPEAIMRAIASYRVTHLFLPPTVLYLMLAHPKVREYDYSSLVHFIIAAAPSSIAKIKEAIDLFGPVMTEGFGQTEAPASITAKAPWDYIDSAGNIDEKRLASVGRPCVFNQVEIMADDGALVPRGTVGEIVVRGRLVTPGYYEDPEATAEVRQFGWHHTGDIGVMDGDGYITIVGRKKDMIISGGFNVYPIEIEQVLSAHPSVYDCAVIAVPDEKWGEAVKAIVVRRPGASVDEEELVKLVKERLGGVKCPKSIEFVSELPRSAVGKVLKTELRKPYWEGRDRSVN